MKSKRVFLLIAAVAVIGLLSGCPAETPEPSSGNVTVTFNTNGAESEPIPPITLKKGESMGNKYPDDPSLTDCYFDGWHSGVAEYKEDTPINASITLTANWLLEIEVTPADLVTITFLPNGGNAMSPNVVKILKNRNLGSQYPTPTYPQDTKTFDGWWQNLNTSNEREITSKTVIETNTIVRAKWNPIPVTVSFNTDGGSPATIAPVPLEKGDTLGAQFPAAPAKTDFFFLGWYKADDTEYVDIYLDNTPIMETLTLKARWMSLSGETVWTVSFNKNHDDTQGFTEAVPPTMNVPDDMKIVGLPVPPTRTYGWSAGMVFDGWNTEADGSGEAFTTNISVTDEIEVFAKWKYQPGTPYVDGDTLVHIGPEVGNSPSSDQTQGTWSGSISEENGSATYTGGAIRYAFPGNIDDYDFFELELIASNTAGGNIGNNIFKQYNTGVDYPPRSGSVNPSIPQGISSYEFEIRGAGATGGIAIQNNNGGARTIKWTKVTFIKGDRVQISFVTDAAPIAPIIAVVDTAIGTLPYPTRPGYSFAGWEDEGGNAVIPATIVPGAMTLTARWEDAVEVEPITVDFTTANVTTSSGSITNLTSTGFRFNKTGSYRTFAKFSVQIPTGANLSAYSSVTVTIQGQGTHDQANNDITYKNVFLLAGTPNLPASFSTDPNSLTHANNVGSNNPQFTDGTQTLTINIDPSLASNRTGLVQFCFYLHAAPAVWDFSNVTFNVRE